MATVLGLTGSFQATGMLRHWPIDRGPSIRLIALMLAISSFFVYAAVYGMYMAAIFERVSPLWTVYVVASGAAAPMNRNEQAMIRRHWIFMLLLTNIILTLSFGGIDSIHNPFIEGTQDGW